MPVSIVGESVLSTRASSQSRDAFEQLPSTERMVVGPRELYALLRRRFVLISTIVCLGTLASLVASYTLPESYTARSMLLLEADDPNLLDDQPDAQARQPSHQTMDTESDLIKSRSFAGRVVDELRLVDDPDFNPDLRRTMAKASLDAKPLSKFFNPFTAFSSSEAKASSGEVADASAPQGAGVSRDTGVPRDAGVRPDVEVQRDRAISVLLSKLSTVRNGESMALTVSVSHDDARKAATLANTVTGQFVEWSRELHRDDIRSAAAFLRQQARDLAANIAKKELEISSYSSRLNVSSDPRDDLLRLAMQQTNEQLSVARGAFTQAQARLTQVRQGGEATAGSDPLLKSDFLTTLRNDEAVALRDRAQLARNYGANHPLIREADAKIATVRDLISREMADIVANLENDVSVARESIGRLEAELGDLNKELRRRSVDEIRLRELNRDLLTDQKLYDLISARLGKLDPYSDAADPGARVISSAEVPTEASFPQRRMMLAGGMAGSLVLAFLVALTLEGTDSRVHEAKRLSALLQAPVLAVIPRMRSQLLGRPLALPDHLRSHPRSRVSEAFHMLCNACRRAQTHPRAHVVMIGSASPSEGRTTTAVGLACASALQGERTVLVDLDGWSDQLHEHFAVDESLCAIERYLDGSCAFDDVVRSVPSLPNLDVAVSTGRRGEASAGISQRERFHAFICVLREAYDLVVVDTPPFLAVEDATAIAETVDAVVLVARCGETTEEAIGQAREAVWQTNARLIGGVLNGVDPRMNLAGLRTSRLARRKAQRYFTD